MGLNPTEEYSKGYLRQIPRRDAILFKSLFRSALNAYETQTAIDLLGHPLALQLERCYTVESIAEALKGQARAFLGVGRGNKIVTSLKPSVQILHKLSGTMLFDGYIGLVCQSNV
jgi:hypothetical protein